MIIDAHNHIGDLSASGVVRSSTAPVDQAVNADVEARLRILDQRGVDQAFVIASHSYLRPDGIADTRRVNDAVAAYRALCPTRFPVGIGVVEPLYGERGYDELARCAEELGLAGISFHGRFQGVSTDSRWVRSYLERIGELGLVAFVHAVGESPEESLWKVEAVARDLPDMSIVVLDAFSTFEQSLQVAGVAERCPNLVFDTATCHGWGFMAPLVERCGASRLVYGSDLYSGADGQGLLHDPLPEILAAPLEERDRADILGGTIARLFGLDASAA